MGNYGGTNVPGPFQVDGQDPFKLGLPLIGGKWWYVNGGSGSGTPAAGSGADGLTGDSWGQAFLTMAKVFNHVDFHSNDGVLFKGNVREQLTAPAGVFDVTVWGAGNRPRHADAHGADVAWGGYSAATWKAPASAAAATPLLKLVQQGWRLGNFLMAGPTDDACVLLNRDAGSGDAEDDASHTEFWNVRFASGYNGINDTGGCFNVTVKNCVFQALTNFCILGVGNIGVGQLQWHILNNHFNNFTNGVKIAAHECVIAGNYFTDGGTPNTTVVLNTSNGAGRDNFVVDNWFQGTTANFNTPDVVGNATDVWYNHALDTAAAGTSGVYEVGQPA